MSETNANKLRIARALAIEAYAALESALVVLFARLLDTTNDKAAIIFFKITNANARNEILGGLLEETHQSKYHTYWHGQAGAQGQKKITGLLALIPQLDQQRNFIVHWHQSSTVTSAGEKWDDLRLPYYWVRALTGNRLQCPRWKSFGSRPPSCSYRSSTSRSSRPRAATYSSGRMGANSPHGLVYLSNQYLIPPRAIIHSSRRPKNI
jgi:hypothetical protein